MTGADPAAAQSPSGPGSTAAAGRRIFIVSLAILFLEMACIRWLNTSIQILAYFNNLILISSFFGLGAGCLLAGRPFPLLRWFAGSLLLLAVCGKLFREHGINVSYTNDIIFVGDPQFYSEGLLKIPLSALVGFLANMTLFIMLGQELGRQFRAMDKPLRAYAYDIAGSIAGTLAYALLSWCGTPPVVWFSVGLVLVLALLWHDRAWFLANIAAGAVALLLVGFTSTDARWSPYYKVETHDYGDPRLRPLGFMIKVDNLRIQDALNFTRDIVNTPLVVWLPYYSLPYEVIRPRRVLILGAGAGNEVVAARDHGAAEIHAVEIDPVIAGMGYALHPQTPYRHPNVRVTVDDARAFLTRTQERYDLVLMSALDSHRMIPGMSSIRLESFIYTKEAFEQVRRRLTPSGAFCLNLSSTRPWMGERTYWSIAEAFGRAPQILKSQGSPFNSVAYVIFNDGRRILPEQLQPAGIVEIPPSPRPPGLRLSTDNWPYLYLERNRIPAMCLVVIALMLVVSTALVVICDRASRKPNFHFFFLGAGFMLLETRSITQMALLFGTTWFVNVIVIASMLAAIFVTNQAVLRGRGLPSGVAYPLLAVTLVLGYFFPFHALLEIGLLARLAVSAVVVGLPVVWASIIFSNSFRDHPRTSNVLGSNLLGVVLGGSLEYTGNVWGLDVLYLVALAIYLISWWCARGGMRARAAV